MPCQRTLIVKNIDFIVFIGKIMNTAQSLESRNARLKIIVDMTTELTWVTDVSQHDF